MREKKIFLVLLMLMFQLILGCKPTLSINEKVNSVYYSSNSGLWIGTDKGLYRVKDEHDSKPQLIKEGVIKGIVEDKDKSIYFGTGKKVVHYTFAQEEKFEEIEPKGMGREDSIIQCLAIDKNNHLWVGRGNDLTAEYDGKNWKTYTIWNVADIDFSGDGTVWLGTREVGLYSIQNETISELNTNNGNFPGGQITDVLVDNYNNLWLATDSGLLKFNHRLWTIYKKENSSIKDNQINTLCLDKNDSLIIGMNSGDLQILSNNKWRELSVGQKDIVINSIFTSPDGIFSIGTNKGLIVFK